MSTQAQRERELSTLLMAAVAGEASADEVRRINELVREDRRLAGRLIDVMHQEAWLTWSSAKGRQGVLRADVAEIIASTVAAEPWLSTVQSAPRAARSRTPSLALAAAVLVATGAALGGAVAWWAATRGGEPVLAVADPDGAFIPDDAAEYNARVVRATACHWSPEVNLHTGANDSLRLGESLSLIEGIAELRLDWSQGDADLRIEGPAGLVLTSNDGCNLTHGKITTSIRLHGDPRARFAIDTPNGRVDMADGVSAGIAILDRKISVHVFEGEAALVPRSSRGASLRPITLSAGESVDVGSDADGKVSIVRGRSQPTVFASQTSLNSDFLRIPSDYVDAVLALKPLIYWRFEGEPGKTVPNFAGEQFSAVVSGSVQFRPQGGNQCVEFGTGAIVEDSLPWIMTEETIDEAVGDAYSLELWIKPNHFQLGSIVSFVGVDRLPWPEGGFQSPHGLLLELGGPRIVTSTNQQPGKIRYLHRSPSAAGRDLGASCFSAPSYMPRRWQHVVAVKRGAAMELYVDGQLAGTANDPTRLAQNVQLLVGQIDQFRGDRPYVGQLDELAFYPIALSEEQIQQHFNLARTPAEPEAPEPAPANGDRDSI